MGREETEAKEVKHELQTRCSGGTATCKNSTTLVALTQERKANRGRPGILEQLSLALGHSARLVGNYSRILMRECNYVGSKLGRNPISHCRCDEAGTDCATTERAHTQGRKPGRYPYPQHHQQSRDLHTSSRFFIHFLSTSFIFLSTFLFFFFFFIFLHCLLFFLFFIFFSIFGSFLSFRYHWNSIKDELTRSSIR